MSAPDNTPLSGNLGKNYRGDDNDWDVPPLIWEAQIHSNYWRHAVGMAENAAAGAVDETALDDVPSPQTAISSYHQWIIEYYNRLRGYSDQLQSRDGKEWWDNRQITLRTWRGQTSINVTVRAGALDVLDELSPQDKDIKPGTVIGLDKLTGLKSLIFVRRITTTAKRPAGTTRNPDKTERQKVLDWLDADTLNACHDGLLIVTGDLGFVPDAKPVVLDDPESLEVDPGHWDEDE